MNQVAWLEQNLDNVKERLIVARQNLQKNPASYSAKVGLQTAEQRLAYLKNRLQNEIKN